MATNGAGPERSALVLYATETGTSQDLAEELGRLTRRLHFSTNVAGLDMISATNLSTYTIVIFVVSTTGQGEFPSNAKRFWTSLLKKKLTQDYLQGVTFALLGLGDSLYPKFNWAARKLEKRLKQLGAKGLIDACEADEQGDEGIDGAFLAWSEALRSRILEEYPLKDGKEPIPNDVLLTNPWVLSALVANGREESTTQKCKFPALEPDQDTRPIPGSYRTTLRRNERLTPSDHWQDVRLLTLSIDEDVEYLPGDALAILPKNFATDVDSLIAQMNWATVADIPIMFKMTTSDNMVPGIPPLQFGDLRGSQKLTLRTLLTDYLDIMAIPRRSFFAAIANCTTDNMHKERLLEFTEPQYLDEFYDYTTRPRRSMLEILQEFDSVKIPWQEAANVFPALRARQFSIASGGVLKRAPLGGTNFELLVAIVKYRTVIKKIREGVCTRYLAVLREGSIMNVCLRTEGRFHPSKADIANKNHLLIGAGTGLAPLRALILEKNMLSQTMKQDTATALFFGARNKDADFFFRDELSQNMLSSAMPILIKLEVYTAFSRDQKEKFYVQDRLGIERNTVYDYIQNKDATVIVCGSSGQMPKAVLAKLQEIMVSRWYNNIVPLPVDALESAKDFFTLLEKQGKYKQETW